jgi:hypothetical protein
MGPALHVLAFPGAPWRTALDSLVLPSLDGAPPHPNRPEYEEQDR